MADASFLPLVYWCLVYSGRLTPSKVFIAVESRTHLLVHSLVELHFMGAWLIFGRLEEGAKKSHWNSTMNGELVMLQGWMDIDNYSIWWWHGWGCCRSACGDWNWILLSIWNADISRTIILVGGKRNSLWIRINQDQMVYNVLTDGRARILMLRLCFRVDFVA